jgi:hypothetical protein
MATPYSDIFNLFLANIQDYVIDDMYDTSTSDFEDYATTFLIRSIPQFDNCLQDLNNRDDTLKTFGIDLSLIEQLILSDLMTLMWLKKEINNILEMRNHLVSGDYKSFSSANNLKEKRTWYETLSKDIDMQITKYGYSNNDWSTFLTNS